MKIKTQQGFIALTATIILSSVLLMMMFTGSTTSFFARFDVLGSEFKRTSLGLSEACVNAALLKIAKNYDYTFPGDDEEAIGPDKCTIKEIDINNDVVINYDSAHREVSKTIILRTQAQYPESNGAWSTNEIQFTVRNPGYSVLPPPTCSLAVSSNSVALGQPIILAWNIGGVASKFWIDKDVASNPTEEICSDDILPIDSTTCNDTPDDSVTYTGWVEGPGGTTQCEVPQSVVVEPSLACSETVMMLDRTGSMSSGDLNDEEDAADGLLDLYDNLNPLPKTAVGVFGAPSAGEPYDATILQGLTTTYSSLYNAVSSGLSYSGGFTNLFSAINESQEEIDANASPSKEHVILLLSDGGANRPATGSSQSTGLFSPTTNGQDSSGEFWSNAVGAHADGGTDASDPVSQNDQHRFSNLNFPTIPSNANITGIEVKADAWATAGTVAGPVTSVSGSPSATISPNQWSNPNNAYTSNNSYATETTNGQQQGYGNFGFNIPSNATITGIGVSTEARINGSGGTSTLLADDFGTGSTSSTVAGWTEGGNGAERRAPGSGNDAASPDGGRFAVIFNDGYICRQVNASGLSNLNISYYWRGDSDAESSDDGIVEARPASGGSCGSSSGWTQVVPDHDLNNDNSWSTQLSTPLPSSFNNSNFLIRFRADSNSNNEFFRVDDVLVTGSPNVTGSLGVSLSSNNGSSWTSSKTTSLDGTESVDSPSGNSSTDMWSRGWVPADFNNGNFALRVQNSSSSGNTVSLDDVNVSVYYTVPVSTPVACQLSADLSWNAGSSWTSEKTQIVSDTETTYTFGSQSDDWPGSHNWSAGEFSNSNFRVRVRASDPGSGCDNNAVMHLDHLQAGVFYSVPADPYELALQAADNAKQKNTRIFTIHFGSAGSDGPDANTTGDDQDFLARIASGNTSNSPHEDGSENDLSGVSSNGNTGFIAPSVQVFDTGGDGDGFEVTPQNAFANDSSTAQNFNGAGDRHRYSGYNFNIPTGVTIRGIEVEPNWWLDSTSSTSSLSISLSWNGGANWTNTKTDTGESTSTSNIGTFGGSSDLWGRSAWSGSELLNGNFIVRATANSSSSFRDFFLDYIPVRVYYSSVPENTDGDNFFVAPTSADMPGIFDTIGKEVCPAAVPPAPPGLPPLPPPPPPPPPPIEVGAWNEIISPN